MKDPNREMAERIVDGRAWGDTRNDAVLKRCRDTAVACVMDALAEAGAVHRQEQDDWAVERATGQRQLDDATALMREAAELFRAYEKHHRDIAKRTGAKTGREEKADRNALAASRLEAWLAGADCYPVSVDFPGVTTREQAERHPQSHQSNIRRIREGGLAEPGNVNSVLTMIGAPGRSLSLADAAVFRLQTPDPRFDPAKPVLVNGYRYTPATEDLCKAN